MQLAALFSSLGHSLGNTVALAQRSVATTQALVDNLCMTCPQTTHSVQTFTVRRKQRKY